MEDYLYITKAFSMKEKTEQEIEIELKKINYLYNKNYSIDEIKQYLNENNELYNYCFDEIGFFENFQYANSFITENSLDVYDDCFEYCLILEVPFNCGYPHTHATNLYLYKFDHKNEKYFNSETIFTKDELNSLYKEIYYDPKLAKYFRLEEECYRKKISNIG
jgi:hypothetical protein